MRLMVIVATIGFATAGLHAQKQVVLTATITDPSGADVSSVDPKDVTFKENGAAGTVLKVEPMAPVVPKIQILIDNGIGIPAASLGDLRTAVKNLINSLPGTVETTLVTTAPQPRTLEKATTDRIKLLSAVDRLTPDSGAGRFVDAMFEATDRVMKDKQETASYTIISIATSAGDLNYRESDVKQVAQRVSQKRINVNVVVLSSLNNASGGGIQVELGKGLADMTAGRFEAIAVPNRLISLLPEIGAQVSKSMGPGAKQFRITLERPASATGEVGPVQLGINGKLLSNVGFQAGK
jgi:hypothetical protein